MIVNEIVPAEVGYLNTIISKKSLRDIISDVIKAVGVARACEFLSLIHICIYLSSTMSKGVKIDPKTVEEN